MDKIRMAEPIISLLEKASAAREPLFDAGHKTAFRLFNGFSEGCPDLVVDLYAETAVLHNYAERPEQGLPLVHAAQAFLQERFPWLQAGIVKTRNSPSVEEKRGKLLFGEALTRKVQEHGVWYALDLCMNQDASLYLDTRSLRQWALQHLRGKTVLNTFAYTGSLGVAACAGGAGRVVQLDLSRPFLNLAKSSYTLNGFPINKADFIVGDFWVQVNRFKRAGERFDCVLVDPPFFSATPKGALDLNTDSARLINKVRPLINDGGWLVSINNALYVSGREYLETLEALCADGYLKITELVPVPEDFTGYAQTRTAAPITDPAPFNHSTKIAVLQVRRKREDG
ncbi:MAG: class I SAM-dependent methyltransferase [Chloroflexi bacterium]|nr:class I SAM-dependent methyltransferase [Chloroflexota bacterium]